MIKIDIDTRCWQIPKEEAFLGVESDDKVKILQFELSKNEFCEGLNFTDCNCFINYKNEGNDTIPYLITDMEVQGDGTVTFTWEVSRGATIFKGNTFAILCAKKVLNDGTITNEWNSRIGSFTVSKGLEPSSSIIEVPEIDIISQLLLVAQQTNANAQNNINQSNSLLEKAEGLGYLKKDFDVLEARMNQFTSLKEGSTTGDAELIDGRIGYDGKVHDNIGGAIREQVGELKSDLAKLGHTSKNILKFTNYSITTENDGVSFSMDDDGKIHMSGKPVGGNFVVVLNCEEIQLVQSDSYTMNSTTPIINSTVYAIRKVAISGTSAELSYGSTNTSKSWTATNSVINRVQISCTSGVSVNFNGYIWITKGTSPTTYEPVGFITDCVKKADFYVFENKVANLENAKADSIYEEDGTVYGIESKEGNISFSKVKGHRFEDRDSYSVTTSLGTSGTARLYFKLDKVPTNKIEIPVYLDEENYEKIGNFGLNVRLYSASKSSGGYATSSITVSYKTKGWGIFEVYIDKMSKTTGFDMSTVEYLAIQFNANANGTNVNNLIIGDIIVDARMKPILLLNFDGLYDSDVNANGKLETLERYKIKATAFELCYLPLSDSTRNAYAEKCGSGLIEIGGHACDVDQFATASNTHVNAITKYKYIKDNLDKISEQSASGNVKSWSNHRNNIPFDVFRFVKSLGCTIQRGGGNPFIHRFTKECAEVNTLALLNSGSAHSVATMKTAIDNAIKYGCAVAISTHEVTSDTTSAMYSESCTPSQFEEFCAYVNTKVESGELITMTFAEFYNACVN